MKSRTQNRLTLHQSRCNHKDVECVSKISLTILSKWIKIIQNKYAMNYANWQHGNNKTHVIDDEKYYSINISWKSHSQLVYTFLRHFDCKNVKQGLVKVNLSFCAEQNSDTPSLRYRYDDRDLINSGTSSQTSSNWYLNVVRIDSTQGNGKKNFITFSRETIMAREGCTRRWL